MYFSFVVFNSVIKIPLIEMLNNKRQNVTLTDIRSHEFVVSFYLHSFWSVLIARYRVCYLKKKLITFNHTSSINGSNWDRIQFMPISGFESDPRIGIFRIGLEFSDHIGKNRIGIFGFDSNPIRSLNRIRF